MSFKSVSDIVLVASPSLPLPSSPSPQTTAHSQTQTDATEMLEKSGSTTTTLTATTTNLNIKTKTVAIVAPQRSNSLDYLNFEEKRRLIASSLSLSDFLTATSGNNNATTKELQENVVVLSGGESCF